MSVNVAREVAAMKRMTVKQLKSKYAEVFGDETRTGNSGTPKVAEQQKRSTSRTLLTGCGPCLACSSARPKLLVCIERRSESLKPLLSNDWEYAEFILDSGAMTNVIPPHVGKAYDIQPSDASKAGVKYKIANGDEIPNLGEKRMLVATAEGSWKGMSAQLADISKPLQAARSLVKAGHIVVFRDGEDGSQNYIVNRITGEPTAVKDDGINYILGLHIAPRSEAGFARPEP